jgi:hypothetical protein
MNSTEIQHTETPWLVAGTTGTPNGVRFYINGAYGQAVADTMASPMVGMEQAEANARFITRACNNHEQLVAALSVLVLTREIASFLRKNDPKALEQAEAALNAIDSI